MRLLALSGSLRAGSTNTALLQAFAECAPPDFDIEVFTGMADLPLFSPDKEADAPQSVLRLAESVAACDGILISCPEYAHGIPGAFKNALDWLVGVGLERRPVGVINPSTASTHAHLALLEIVRTMDGELVEGGTVAIPAGHRRDDPDALVADPAVAALLAGAVAALAAAAR